MLYLTTELALLAELSTLQIAVTQIAHFLTFLAVVELKPRLL